MGGASCHVGELTRGRVVSGRCDLRANRPAAGDEYTRGRLACGANSPVNRILMRGGVHLGRSVHPVTSGNFTKDQSWGQSENKRSVFTLATCLALLHLNG